MKIVFSIKQRLMGLGLLSLIFIGVVSAAGFWGASRLSDAVTDISMTSTALRNQIQADVMRSALHADVLAALQAGDAKNQGGEQAAGRDAIKKDMASHGAIFRENISKNAALPLNRDVKDILNKTRPAMEAYIEIAGTVVQLAFENHAAASARLPEYMNTFKILAGTMSALGEMMEESMKESQDVATAKGAIARNIISVAMIVALVSLTIIALLLIRSITRPLAQVVALANTIASGDLTSEIGVKTTDESGKMMQALKDMNDSLYDIVGNARGSVDSISTAAKEIAAGISDLSQRTEEQASSLEETASSMEELAATVKHNAENAKQASQLAKGNGEIAVKGGQVVHEVVQAMASINESSRKIADIISVIEGIAFQTNILALNAAVEAARAGEQGRGFAVVAAEVRNLAQRSAAAAKEIKILIGDSVVKVEGGTKLVDEAGKTMAEIVTAVKRVTDIMAEIAAASAEQSTGIDQVNRAITQMDEVTQQNAALVEEAAAAAESMEEEALNLAQSVSVFKLGDALNAKPQARRAAASGTAGVAGKPSSLHTLAAPERRGPGKPKVFLENAKDGEWEEF